MHQTMNKKSVIISESNEGTHKVAVKLDLCSYYREIVEGMSVRPGEDHEFQRQVNLIVWGSFYIEAAMNQILGMIVDDSVQGILAPEDVFSSLERLNVEKKIMLILRKLGNDESQALRKEAIDLFDLRNKLAHPKEKKEETELTISSDEEIRPSIDAAREVVSSLEKDIFSTPLCERKANILKIGGWIESSIFEYYKRKKDA